MTPPDLYRAWLLCQEQTSRLDSIVSSWRKNLHRLPPGPGLDEYQRSIDSAVNMLTANIKPYTDWLLEENRKHWDEDVAKNSWFRRGPAWHVVYIDTLYSCAPTELKFAIHLLRTHSDHRYSCLYLGSGKGVWKRELATFSPIVCADINPQLFEYVKEGYADIFFEMDRMRFVTVKMKQLQGMADNSVEFVFSWGTFPLLSPDEITAMLKEINRVLKPGGRAQINFADAFNSEDYAWIEQKHWAYMDRWKFIDIVRDQGFVPLKITVDDTPRSTCMLFQKPGDDSIYGPVEIGCEKLDAQSLDNLITISELPKEETQS
jgi:hypothetical protein